ncbi:hypothetical protein SD77_0623 [Bacillus badius]|uniref:Uncharacterized protein n=1 Tax=Bacillus badius TaxID=1455 RepID=A0ABR5B1Y1_BACBA|nr:hypothetical protein SD78_4171 [Bacillus badius]KIL80775.1 hypothetical protein SD77_0623 [Bacillus badius]
MRMNITVIPITTANTDEATSIIFIIPYLLHLLSYYNQFSFEKQKLFSQKTA